MKARIRVARLDDQGAVTSVLRSAYSRLMAGAYEPSVLAAAVASMGRANPALLTSGAYYVVEVDTGGIVACGGWTRAAPGSGTVAEGVAHLRHFATHADWSGQGFGGLIFERCATDAGKAGIATFECYASLNAERFYNSLGLTTIGAMEIVLTGGKRFECLRMRGPV